MRFQAKKNAGCPIELRNLMAFSSPRQVVLRLPSPSPRVCTGGWAYADVTTKISRIDRLQNLLRNGAPLARCACSSRCGSAVIGVIAISYKLFELYNWDTVY